MWQYRIKSTTNHNNDNNNNNNNNNDNNIYESSPKTPRSPSNPDFNHQSLKDIQTLFPRCDNYVSNANTKEKETSSPQNFSTTTPSAANNVKQPSIFHRVHLANRFTRVFSARPKPGPKEYSSELDQGAVDKEFVKSESWTEPVTYYEPARMKPEKLEKTEKSVKPYPRISIPGAEKQVVIYITSLRAVRATFDACQTVRSILQGFRVPVDERDLLMDASFFDEIRKIMAQMGQDKRVILPKVFIGGRYIGGADEVVELHEIGKLKKLLSGLPEVTPGVCEICGGFRFVLCEECNGSHKCHIDDENGGFRTCTECNENGLIRCPSCLNS